jgi:hypothetical protein
MPSPGLAVLPTKTQAAWDAYRAALEDFIADPTAGRADILLDQHAAFAAEFLATDSERSAARERFAETVARALSETRPRQGSEVFDTRGDSPARAA